MSDAPPVSGRSRPVVSRNYEPVPDACVRAFELLLCRTKKTATRPGGPDEGTKFKEDSAGAPIIPK